MNEPYNVPAESASALARAFLDILQAQANFRTPSATLAMQQTAISQRVSLRAEPLDADVATLTCPGQGYNRVLVSPTADITPVNVVAGPVRLDLSYLQANPQTIGGFRVGQPRTAIAVLPNVTYNAFTGLQDAYLTQVDLAVPDGDVSLQILLANANEQHVFATDVILTWYRVA